MPTISKKQFREYIEGFDFAGLFNVLGWNYVAGRNAVRVNDCTFTFNTVAEKSGFRILVCDPGDDGKIPDYSTRLKIDRAASRLYFEHLMIFQDRKRESQLWQILTKVPDTPDKTAETRWCQGQEPELLYQKASGLFFTMEEEDRITIVDVTQRVNDNFNQNREKVTRKFYERFRAEHKSFIDFIKGIKDQADKEWYASLMLNRLMFCYFIQKQGFLDNDKNYLYNKLRNCQEKKGQNKFYSFYRDFLLALFHQGLGAPTRSPELQAELGCVPYLNGGLFDVHKLEKEYKEISIDDESFETIFNFFDEWKWHLDSRESASGKEIDPDVLGYIFEKYINDRAQMGAYYTREDITNYISKNSIIPFLFNQTQRLYQQAFNVDGELWSMMKNSGDTYIYDAVKYGINPNDIWIDLPVDVYEGLNSEQPDLVGKRRCWNRPAPEEVALRTEIWREVIERRKNYIEVSNQINNGAITYINDFITYNLDIRQFAQDLLRDTNDPKLIMYFYQALNTVTILDPTCGSGAFLFAAMNILEDLYEICLLRMENFVTEASPGLFKSFEDTLSQVNAPEHPNRKYFIYKNIILKNLYGVDIMHEAVEIAKLRLFLKLVATVDPDYRKPNLGLEPLPDIDHNIRTGNTLVGYASEMALDEALTSQLDFDNDKGKFNEQCNIVALNFAKYKETQLNYGNNYQQFRKAKTDLEQQLETLTHELNALLYKQTSDLGYEIWLKTHQPFHWLAEFYEIIHDKGGFDVIIGNPPYVEYKDIKTVYSVNNFQCITAGDLYGFVMERSLRLSKESSRIGFIVPMSCFTVDGFSTLQNLYYKNNTTLFISNWSGDAHPSKLFEGVDKRLHILLGLRSSGNNDSNCKVFITKYNKWYSGERNVLFDTRAKYYCLEIDKVPFFSSSIPKINSTIEEKIIRKIKKQTIISFVKSSSKTEYEVFYTRKASFFLQFIDFIPVVKDSTGRLREPSELKRIYFPSKHLKNLVLCALSSSTFYWYYILNSDCRNLNKREVLNFKIPNIDESQQDILLLLANKLMSDYKSNSFFRSVFYENRGEITVQYFNFRLSKSYIDQIDELLAKHYNFTPEELDFIINYDIKYRMGKEIGEM